MISRLPWWPQQATTLTFRRSIASLLQQLRGLPPAVRSDLQASAFVCAVLVSCEAERRLPVELSEEEVYRHLSALYKEILRSSPAHLPLNQRVRQFFCSLTHSWGRLFIGHGFRVKAYLAQLEQHLKALMYLCIYNKDKVLNSSIFRSTHIILMKGYWQPVGGRYRNSSLVLHGGGPAFVHESAVESSVKDMLLRLQAAADAIEAEEIEHCFDFPDRCAALVHDMTHIQPFHEGNEWMCRLLIAFCLMKRGGFEFPIPIAGTSQRHYEHFHLALREELKKEDACGFRREKAILSAYILECVLESLEEVCSSNS